MRVLTAVQNGGFVTNVNRGFDLSRNDVVVLNADTVVTKGWLERMHRCLLSDPTIRDCLPTFEQCDNSLCAGNEPTELPS